MFGACFESAESGLPSAVRQLDNERCAQPIADACGGGCRKAVHHRVMNLGSRELLELVLPNLRDFALVLLDERGVVVGWLAGAELIFGYAPEEMVGRPISALFVEEDREKALDLHELEVARRDSYSQDDRWHVRKDGQRIWISGSVTPLREGADLRGFVKIMRDRTDSRILSEKRANELAAIQDAIERTRMFIRTLGHELRNPLAPIKIAALIAAKATDEPRVQQAARTIGDQVAVLERLAADLMDVSRLHHRNFELRLSEFDLRELARDEAKTQMDSAAAKGVSLEVLLPEGSLPVTADPDRLRQALANLLINAIKYTPAGGSIWVKATEEAQDAVLRVEDTGIGIAADVLPRIFELFTQESRASEMAPGGLGVGLAVVKQIAELHGGVV